MKLENTEPMKVMLPEWLLKLSDNIEINVAQCEVNEVFMDGDILITYHAKDSLESEYRKSILILDIENEAEENMYLRIEDLDSFKGALMGRLEKTKLWNYPPDTRDGIKRARNFLRGFLEYDVSYGFSVLVPAGEAEAFMADGKNRFGIRSCKYYTVQKPGVMPVSSAVTKSAVYAGAT